MIDDLNEDPTTAVPSNATMDDSLNQAKRRKVRKGTRSFWECKRQKIRCIFTSPDDVTCTGCQRRHAPCISQEMPEDFSPARKGNRHLGQRISRVEGFMKDFLASKHVGATSQVEEQPWQDNYGARATHSNNSEPSSIWAPLTPTESLGEFAPTSSIFTTDAQGVSGQAELKTVLYHLISAFPAEGDAKILLRESLKPSRYTLLLNTQPHSKLTHEKLAASYSPAELSGPQTHPVIWAKLMLIFAITLQSPCGENFPGLSEPQSVLMRRLTTAATTWVTTKEERHGTVESLICIMLEGVFQVNSSNLRRAWVVYRRALTVA
ncbi:uncharacterized protein BCR38DRAFT_516424 [Pseudomassariella vexata]|uniref:Zn(2)-C6 fungal-type domain-containing protein n=1 Tax=Pseudomassariella vexata TaxID=1141098 RepID=A0A1Y2DVF8_9PEZI|nr:uncharacterized protein BCR38DRAFT_516424 [Pseudomassariella vexata]ORY63261.1 hypothetical protein BCR38DRAFT_516424 [Pseudomassariella vexata]